MASFVCLFNGPRASSPLRSSRSPRTTDVREASHLSNGVAESRRLPAYSLSSWVNFPDNSSTIYSSLNLSIGEFKRRKNKMKKNRKRVKKENLRYFKAFTFLENLSSSEEDNNAEKIRKKKRADRNKIMKISQDESTIEPDEVTTTPAIRNSDRLYRARETGRSRLRDQLISRKASRVPAPSVNPKSVNNMGAVGPSPVPRPHNQVSSPDHDTGGGL